MDIRKLSAPATSLSPAQAASRPEGSVRTQTVLTIVLLGAVSLRLLSALYMGSQVGVLPGIYDQVSYDALAQSLAVGQGFTFATGSWPGIPAHTPTSFWSFAYALYLGSIYAVFGHQPLLARLIQAILAGCLMPYLMYRLGKRLFGGTAGMVAAALSAGYIYFVYYAGALMTETFYILAILWAVDLVTGRLRDAGFGLRATRPGLRGALAAASPWLMLGLALGVAVLLRQLFLGCVPFLFAWMLWTRWQDERRAGVAERNAAGWRQTVDGLALVAVVVGLMIAPWTVRNYLAFHRFVPLNTNAGYAFFWGNHPIYGTDFVPILRTTTYQDLIPVELRGLDEAALDQALLHRAVGFIVDDPGRYALLSLSRVKAYFQFWPSADSGLVSNISRVLSFGIALPFMLYGLVLAAVGRRVVQPGQWPAVVLLYLFIGVYSLIHLLSWALIRYRLPVDAVLILFASVALVDLIQRVRGKQ